MGTTRLDREIALEREELRRIINERKKNKKLSKKKNKKIKKGKTKLKIFFGVMFNLGSIGIITVLFLLYGPWAGFRNWLVTTAMTTMTHQYFATWFYDDNVINDVLNNNKVVELEDSTNTDLININTSNKVEYANEYERQILERDEENNDYKIIEIEGKGYSGYLVAVYEPSRIKTVVTAKLGSSGQYLTKMASDNDAVLAINGGGFNDPNFNSTGGSPLGITVTSGKYVTTDGYGGSGGIIDFTEDDVLVLEKCSLTKAKQLGIRDAVTFGPFLIVNGTPAKVLGNGGWGLAPRTVIGQRQDGIVLLLVIDGRKAGKMGADMDDLIDIMLNYGAYNAANLDGGTSSVLVVDNTIVNDPIDSTGAHKTRPISTGFILTKDESDDGDRGPIEDKLSQN